MISQIEAVEIIVSHFPELQVKDSHDSVYHKFDTITNFAITLFDNGQFDKFQKIVHLLERVNHDCDRNCIMR